jgi:regulator of protease activity HflC (stomatin/prohibitin superfamily)
MLTRFSRCRAVAFRLGSIDLGGTRSTASQITKEVGDDVEVVPPRRKKEDMNTQIIIAIIAVVAITAVIIRKKLRHEFTVAQGFAGLLYKHGKFAGQIIAGRHVRWGRGYTFAQVDLRKATLAVTGQEILTADNVGLKASLLVTYEVADAVKAVHTTQQWYADLYNFAQLALRTVAGGVPVETLLTQRTNLAPQLLVLVQPEAVKIGINVLAVEVKDVMFPADLKRVFADVLKAKQEGQAALERARGESAALRNLANAARVLDGNPALMNLRLMQSLSAAQNSGNTLVLGMPAGFLPLKNGKAASAATNMEESGSS